MLKKRKPFCIVLFLFLSLLGKFVFGIDREKILYFNDIDGLPRNIVTCIEQDKYGYTWIGTGNGISRFDGHTFYNYQSLEGLNINSLLVDHTNRLWVTCDEGLFCYNRLNDQFEQILPIYYKKVIDFNNKIYITSGEQIKTIDETEVKVVVEKRNVNDFFIDQRGMWVSNALDGVLLYSVESNFKTISHNFLSGKDVNLIRKVDDKLFFACRSGELFLLDEEKQLRKIKLNSYPSILEIVKVDDQIWLATDGEGIIILDDEANYLYSLRKNSNLSSKLNSNSIYDIYPGSNNEVWVGTYSAGLICLQPDNSPFKNIVPEPRNINSLVDKEGTSILASNGKLYFGTNYGLSILNEKNGKFTNIRMQKLKTELNDVKVLALNADSLNNIWLGTYGGLLGKYDSEMKLIQTFHPCSNNSYEMQRIVLLHKYDANHLLIGTHFRNKSLLNFDTRNGEAKRIIIPNGSFKRGSFQITSIRENRKGETIIVIRNEGIYLVNTQQNQLENVYPEINKRVTFRINDMYQDKNGLYWFATQKDGLVRISEDGRQFDKWETQQGLPSLTLLRMESIDDRFLWISTISGLCRFDMETEQILVFNHRHNLPANEFTQRTSLVTNDQRIIFGSTAGFTIVDPKKVQTDVSTSEVIISDITFQNKSIKHIPNKSYLKQPLEETRFIKLPYGKNSFTIHFFSKDKDLPQYNNYAYRLVGFENEWIYLGNTKQTTYTNLSPGKYTFEVKSTNKSNVWNDTPTQLQIKITPPWYLSWYAFALYILAVGLILLVGNMAYINKVLLKKEIEMSEYKINQEHELTERKLAFFTNISHDLKTPLTLIDAPVNELLDLNELSENSRNKLLIIKRNSQRLYKLISDILDFRKLTQKQMPLRVQESKIDQIIENISVAFQAECNKKQIDFNVHNSVDQFIFIEVKKIEKILWNLVSNAIKFTDREGEIYLSAEKVNYEHSNFLKLIVKDSGIGIPNEEKSNIFNRFYQKRDNISHPSDGAGIGLSIVKELVELHHGTIEVESKLGIGTTFTALIPVDKEEYMENEIAQTISDKNEHSEVDEDLNEIRVDVTIENNNYNLPILLIVEDNLELREYMAGYFGKNYKVYLAGDGIEGVDMVKRKKPDIILTDVLMPNMDGNEFCKTIRSNFDTSHLPIIMLTANSMMEQQIEGLKLGADSYVVKPFDIKYLETLLSSTLNNRKKIRQRIMGSDSNNDCDNNLTQKDIEFIEELRNYIRENISNQQLNVDSLSEHFSISRTQLNRKIKALTGQTPNNLIKSIRLKMAYDLIREKGLRVSEAAYQTGFSDPNYFTICFKKEFGENPSKV